MRKPVFLLFIDLTAAFDHVVREWLFKAIYQRFPEGADKSIFELLESLYKYTTTSLAETTDNVFELMLGVRRVPSHSHYLICIWILLCGFIWTDAERKI